LQLNFSSFSCVFESRECNKVAHALAKLGSECVGMEEPVLSSIPFCIQTLVAGDLLASE
jgi:hypothetical protein